MKNLRTGRALALAGSALALSVALTGCSALNGIIGGAPQDAERDDKGNVTEDSNIGIFALKVGDCKMESPSGLIEDADVVPCDKPHDEEVYHELKMDDGEFSQDAVDAASEECFGEVFTAFVGIAYEESALDVYTIVPTQDTWDSLNDRVVQCLVYEDGVKTTGTLKGAGR